ncbi:MAG: peptidylprolyl isomerase [Chlorobium sp.]|nr:MAG: peptidylprolyl isomerase [Chlorobium sp.]
MKKVLIKAALLLFLGSSFLQAPVIAEVVDRIAAVVGHEAIFKSEIDTKVLMARMQYPELATDKGLARSILDGMIDQKLILAKAKIDSVSIDENSIDGMTNDRFRQLSARFASKAEMESRLGKSSAAIREEVRKDLRNQELIDKFRRKKSAGITVTYDEVMAFYTANRNNISDIPEEVSVSQILKYAGVSEESKSLARAAIERVRKELQGGADFAALARKYSQDPGSADSGGDLGFVQKGELIKSFEDTAYALKEGQVSDVVETRYGFHLIQLLSKETNSIHVRHILIGFNRATGDFTGVIKLLNAVRADVLSGKVTFADMARKYSDDPTSSSMGGTILVSGSSSKPLFPPTSLRPQLQQIIRGLKNPEDISEPQKIEPPQGEPFYAIFRLNERVAGHPFNPEKDYSLLEEQALDAKNATHFNAWVQQLRKEVYVYISDI